MPAYFQIHFMSGISDHSSLAWDSTGSSLQYPSSSSPASFSTESGYYDRSLVVPLKLSERQSHSPTSSFQVPSIKLCSASPGGPHAPDDSPARSMRHDIDAFNEQLDRLRISLSVRPSRSHLLHEIALVQDRVSRQRYVF